MPDRVIDEPRALPIVEESLRVDKTPVDRGGYRVTKHVTTRTERIDLPLRHRGVDIERRPIGVFVEGSELPQPHHEGETWVIPVLEEVVVKRTRYVEELRITPIDGVRSDPQQISLRTEDISIERLDAAEPPPTGPSRSPSPGEVPTSRPGHQRGAAHMRSVLVGMFDSQTDANRARDQLIAAGFAPSSISMAGGEMEPAPTQVATDERSHDGPIMRFLKAIFGDDDVDETHSRTYEEAFRRGSYGLTVSASTEEELDRAEEILNSAGAIDIDSRAQQWRAEGWSAEVPASTTAAAADDVPAAGAALAGNASDATTDVGADIAAATPPMTEDRPAFGQTLEAGGTRKLQELEEQLTVGKRVINRGGVRIYSRMVDVPVQETVRLREEHAEVQRREVDRPATEGDFAAFKEGSMEVRETGEEAVVAKTARVVGEVEIGKSVTEREETISDTVRKTKVDVEPLESARSGATDNNATTEPATSAREVPQKPV